MPVITYPIVDIVNAAETAGTLPPVSQTQSDSAYGRFFFAPNANDRIVVHTGSQFNAVFVPRKFVVYRSTDAGVTWNAYGLTGGPTGLGLNNSTAWDGANTLYMVYRKPNAAGDPNGLWFVPYDLTTNTFGTTVDLSLFYGQSMCSCWRSFDGTICVISTGQNPMTGLFETYITRLDTTGTILSTGQVNHTALNTGDFPNPGRICEGDASSGIIHMLSSEQYTGAPAPNTLLTFQSMDASNALSTAQAVCGADNRVMVSGLPNSNHDLSYDPTTNKIRVLYSNYAHEYIATGGVTPNELTLRVLVGTSAFNTTLTLEGTATAPGVRGSDFVDEQANAITTLDPTVGIFWHMGAGGGTVTVGTYQSLNYQAPVLFTGTDGNEFNFNALPLDNLGNYAFCWYQKAYVQGVLQPPPPPTGGTYTFSHNGRIAQRRRTVLAV